MFDDDSELEEMSPAKSKSSSPKRRKVGFNNTTNSPSKFGSPSPTHTNRHDAEESPAKSFSDFAVPRLSGGGGLGGFGLNMQKTMYGASLEVEKAKKQY